MKKVGLLITAILYIFEATGQISGVDHLLPATEFENGIKTNKEYHGKVLMLLDSDFPNESIISYSVFPSFSAEYSFSIQKKNNSSYVLKKSKCSENYWYSKDKTEIKVKTEVVRINKKTTKLLIELFGNVLNNCKEHVLKEGGIEIIGFDGTNYYFLLKRENEIQTGKTWSPRTKNMKELVAINDSIFSSSNLNNKVLNNRIKKLINEIK